MRLFSARGAGRAILSMLDQVPKLGILLQGFIFPCDREVPEQEVLHRVPTENAVYHHAKLMLLEIDAVILQAKAIQHPTIPFELTEVLHIRAHDFEGNAAEFTEDGELEFLGDLSQFSAACRIEDDLELPHAGAIW